jgi:hypothetical protein
MRLPDDADVDVGGAFRLILDYGFFTVVTDQANVDPVPSEISELFHLTPTSVRVCTGMAYGSLRLRVQAFGHADVPDPDPGAWEAIGVAVVESPSGDIHVEDVEPLDLGEWSVNLATAGPGRYALRVCARRRGGHEDLVGPSDPARWEEYLLQVWPTDAPRGLTAVRSDHIPKFRAHWLTVTDGG